MLQEGWRWCFSIQDDVKIGHIQEDKRIYKYNKYNIREYNSSWCKIIQVNCYDHGHNVYSWTGCKLAPTPGNKAYTSLLLKWTSQASFNFRLASFFVIATYMIYISTTDILIQETNQLTDVYAKHIQLLKPTHLPNKMTLW
jgi:hypothetical protein